MNSGTVGVGIGMGDGVVVITGEAVGVGRRDVGDTTGASIGVRTGEGAGEADSPLAFLTTNKLRPEINISTIRSNTTLFIIGN